MFDMVLESRGRNSSGARHALTPLPLDVGSRWVAATLDEIDYGMVLLHGDETIHINHAALRTILGENETPSAREFGAR